MAPPDLTVEYTDIRDFSVPQRDGQTLTRKRVVFWIGKFGPFTEYFDVDGFTMTAVTDRVNALKREVEGIHQ